MKKCIYDYAYFVEKLCSNPDRKEIIEKYESFFGPINEVNIEETPFYKHSLSKFNIDFSIVLPFNKPNTFDWHLFFRLIFGSSCTEYSLYLSESWKKKPTRKLKVELIIHVTSETNSKTKSFHEIGPIAIYELFTIYIIEQISFHGAMKEEGPLYEEIVDNDGKEKLMKFNKKIENLRKEADLYFFLSKQA